MNKIKFPKLHIFLGAGGVGKTTLSASFALSLANSGRKVGLISIDPAKRLQSALGINFNEQGIGSLKVNNNGELLVSMLQLDQVLKRWIDEKNMADLKKQKLMLNPYYSALSEKLASSSDTLAAIFIAEWVEKNPQIDDLIIDTAPGLHAIDFILKPEKVSLFLDSKLVDWLKVFVGSSTPNKTSIFAKILKSSAKKIMDGLSFIGGQNFLINFGEFLVLLDEIFLTAIERLNFARKWIFDDSTSIVLVTSIREDSVSVAQEFSEILIQLKLNPKISIINRALSQELINDSCFVNLIEGKYEKNSAQDLFSNYFSSYSFIQNRVRNQLELFSKIVIDVPISSSLDKDQNVRLTDLNHLGEFILNSITSQTKNG